MTANCRKKEKIIEWKKELQDIIKRCKQTVKGTLFLCKSSDRSLFLSSLSDKFNKEDEEEYWESDKETNCYKNKGFWKP